jgi:hypothetical protein
MDYRKEIELRNKRIEALTEHARYCLDYKDWHGLRDVAADIEVQLAYRDAAMKFRDA